MNATDHPLRFNCQGSSLVGIATLPAQPGRRGVLVVTGGPQYRVGSHRQFTLLARALGASGIPVLRFDYRGMGDSEGVARSFENIHDDIQSALKEYFILLPEMKEIVMWGLCDGATASVFYAPTDPRVTGLVLLNPWVRTPQGAAQATLKHYYIQRLGEREFWQKLAGGAFRPGNAIESLREQLKLAAHGSVATLPQRVFDDLSRFDGRVLLILSGRDLGAHEFTALLGNTSEWRKLAARWQRIVVPEANHTFARRIWREQVERACIDWIGSW